jgi:Tfp pilus assembly protein PilF
MEQKEKLRHGTPLAHSRALALHGPEGNRYSGFTSRMKLPVIVGLAVLLATGAPPAYADARGEAKAYVTFGIDMAQRGLWREAVYRWERAVEIDPTYAEAFNNLAIGYEQAGALDKALAAYEKALALDPDNVQIRQNYELFRDINDRASNASDR